MSGYRATAKMGSQYKSIAAYHPIFPAPDENSLIANNIHGGSKAKRDHLASQFTPAGGNAAVVSARFSKKGMRYLYTYSHRARAWFRMIATGQAESTKFQPQTDHVYDGSFNDQLYRVGGYPQNLGLSFKVTSIPDAIAKTAAWGRMRPRPQQVTTIYSNRAYGVRKGKPAVGVNPYPVQRS